MTHRSSSSLLTYQFDTNVKAMNAVLALVFFACIAGSMANPMKPLVDQLIQQGHAAAQTVVSLLQQQILALAQQAVNQLNNLVGGRLDVLALLQPLLNQLTGHLQGLLAGVLQSITSSIGGRAELNLSTLFNDFLASITPAITGLGQHFLNQGLSAVLGAIGGRAGFGDIFANLSAQIAGLVGTAQETLAGVLGNIQQLGSSLLDASKPHWEQLQEQLVGHGLNALGSLSETINNLHGSITGGR